MCFKAQLQPLQRAGIFRPGLNPVNMHPYAAQARMGSLDNNQKWAYGSLSQLSSLARAMGYLVSSLSQKMVSLMLVQIEGTIGMCHNYLQELAREPGPEPGAGKA